ncbi:MAG: DUF512 domain-containing protein [Ruminococcaceae bacterium]|nr:DUF512 domain-containing protein [Oscillospiraceae bacterium]
MVKICGIEKNSYAEKVGIMIGDELISVCGNEIRDVLDYRFYIMEKKITVEVERGGERLTFPIKKKDEYDDIGLEFETYLMDKKHSCKNKCVFCFIDQNPHGMRESIYFKDDDSRLSFFFGNYVTLTNLSDEEVDRIIKMRISPVNISVHTTNPELRCRMMKNPNSGTSLRYLQRFRDGEIMMNCQIVLCKGLNDGEELKKTLSDLCSFYPYVESIAVVPAGLTGHRDGLYPLEPFTKEDSIDVLDIINAQGDMNLAHIGRRLVYASDEWYLKAEREIPDQEYYEEYPQLENGVGMIRSMGDEVDEELEYLSEDGFELENERCVSVVTGEAAFGFIKECAEKIMERYPKLRCNVYCAKNKFFGGSVTVAGLLTGQDMLEALEGRELGEELFIPECSLRHERDLFLDDMSIDEFSEKLGVKVTPNENNGGAFVRDILGS